MRDDVLGVIYNLGLTEQIFSYLPMFDDNGNLIHLPESGGLIEQDAGLMNILYEMQRIIKSELSRNLNKM